MIPMGSEPPRHKVPNNNQTLYVLYEAYQGSAGSCADYSAEGGCDLEWCEYTPAITEVQFYLSYVLGALSFPYCMAICQAVYSKVIGPRPQGLWMGLLTAIGSLARICGPIFISFIYKSY